ncbi:MAG: type IV secretion system protein [Paludibacteraceae bacterium]|nr:type IV secretion system protein [Paludibacteraceae bacterium]
MVLLSNITEKVWLGNLSIIDSATVTLISQISIVAMSLAALLFVCNMAYNYLKNGFFSFVGGSKGEFPDYREIGRCLAIIIMITLYLPISQVIVGTVEVINAATEPANLPSYAKNLQTLTTNAKSHMETVKQIETLEEQNNISQEEKSTFSQIKESITDAWKEIANYWNAPVAMTLHLVVEFLTMLVGAIIKGVVVVVSKILVILGPLAFAFAILPCFKKQIEAWFSTLLNSLLTITTLNILDNILDSVLAMFLSGSTPQSNETMIMDMVILICYIAAFWLTSKIVGQGDAGQIFSSIFGATTAAAGLVIGGASMSASAAANSAQSSNDIIKKNDNSQK